MNTLEGYPIHIAHASLSKTFSFTDQVKAVFTAQVSNVTNTAHFTIPNNNISTPNPGLFSFASLAPNSTPERLGNRQIDLKLRLGGEGKATGRRRFDGPLGMPPGMGAWQPARPPHGSSLVAQRHHRGHPDRPARLD